MPWCALLESIQAKPEHIAWQGLKFEGFDSIHSIANHVDYQSDTCIMMQPATSPLVKGHLKLVMLRIILSIMQALVSASSAMQFGTAQILAREMHCLSLLLKAGNSAKAAVCSSQASSC